MSGFDATDARAEQLFDAYVFDLDGTIYIGDELLPGAHETITALRQARRPVRFLSNNPTRDRRQYAEKLTRLGLPTRPEETVNTIVTVIDWLRAQAPGATVFALGEAPLQHALAHAGIPTSENPAEIDVVVASYDRGLTYRKLQIAFDAIWFHRRARLIATNPDRYCPMPGGHGEPDCAAITAAIEASTGVCCEAIVGKPNPIMLTAALAGLDVDLSRCIMVGDRLSTDILLGIEAGTSTALVLTGDSQRADLDEVEEAHLPTMVLSGIADLLPRQWS